jgi:general secretion pathway protein A
VYEHFFGLRERPFSLTPDPRYVYHAPQYRHAGENIRFGVSEREGFMVLTGVPGSGKTTLCRDLVNRLDPRRYCTALIFNPFLNAVEMLQALLTEYGVSYPPEANRKELLERLNNFLLAQLVAGRTCIAIFDEAQHLAPEFLEQIRVLSNLETEQEKLIQIILVGQPELLERLSSPAMAQLDQRVSVRCTLGSLSVEETDRYIHHRLNVAGAKGEVRFTASALRSIHSASGGVPRLVNLITDRTLLAGYADQSAVIRKPHVRRAVKLLRGQESTGATRRRVVSLARWAALATVVVLLLVGAVRVFPAVMALVR